MQVPSLILTLTLLISFILLIRDFNYLTPLKITITIRRTNLFLVTFFTIKFPDLATQSKSCIDFNCQAIILTIYKFSLL